MKLSVFLVIATTMLVAVDAQAVNTTLHDGPMAAIASSRVSSSTGSGNSDSHSKNTEPPSTNVSPGTKDKHTSSGSSAGAYIVGSHQPPKTQSDSNLIMCSLAGSILLSIVSIVLV